MRFLATFLVTAHIGASLLLGCTGNSKSSYPENYPNPPVRSEFDVWYTLSVAQPSQAGYAVSQAVEASGGYVFDQYDHQESGERYVVVEANVPTGRLGSFEASLARIGHLSGSSPASHSSDYMSQVGITLKPKPSPSGYVEIGGWRPGETFQAALGVLGSILRVLIDFLIWAGVLIGPFVLIGYAVRYAMIRKQFTHKRNQQRSKK